MQPLDRLLPHLDVYVPSMNEGSHQTGLEDPRTILKLYRDCGAPGLIGVKLGSKGALLSPAAGEFIEIPAVPPPGAIVDTTGAGDCFYAGLLTGLLRGMDVARAGRLGAAAGACCVTALGATAGIRDFAATTALAGIG
jgi:fructokinase